MRENNTFTRLDLLRHGECEGGHIFRGSSDVALSSSGRIKMHTVVSNINPDWDVIVSSPLIRCLSFAEELARKHDIDLEIEEGLREMHFGDWEGREIAEIWRVYEKEMRGWSENPEVNGIPNGEKLVDVSHRVLAVKDRAIARHQGKNILLVTHGGVIRVLLSKVLVMPLAKISTLDVPYACISRVLHSESEQGVHTKVLAHNFIHAD